MSKSVQLLAGLWLCLLSISASAYHLDDHRAIATQAYREFAACFPEAASRLDLEALVQADLDEDLNLLEKLLMYSHFFNPNKDLQMWRYGSGDRVADIESSLLQCRGPAVAWAGSPTDDLGHLIHHFQDMTVPAHVVPVHHSAWDGFEVYEFRGPISSGWTCSEIAASGGADLSDVLKQTALDTLASVKTLRIQSKNKRNSRGFAGADFWTEAPGDGFGKYGKLGNTFGTLPSVPDGAFQEFKGQQMDAAVRVTLRALAWAFPQQ